MDKKDIILKLHEIGAIQVGEFTLASGLISNVYIDIRRIISYPSLLKAISEEMWSHLSGTQADLICGVPYTALPTATHMSIEQNVPMIMVRKEAKKYGTKKQIEGVYKKGQTCYIIEDLVTTGGSVIKVANLLEAEGLLIKDVVVLIDRQQGGKTALQENNYQLHAVLTITEVFDVLAKENRLTSTEEDLVDQYFKTLEF